MDIDRALESARRICADVLAPDCAHVDRSGTWPERGMRSLQREGFGALVVPRELGGHGLGLYGLARVCEILAEGCPSTAICLGMHCVASAVIAARATAAQRDKYLAPICRGEHLTTLALSEPGTGASFYIPEATLRHDERGHFVVNGDKSFVTNGGHADSYVISTSPESSDAAPGEFSCLVLPADAPGVSFGDAWAGWGMRGNSSRTMRLRQVSLERDALLGAEGDEIWFVFNVIAPYFLVAMSGTYAGIANAALKLATEHVKTRRHSHTGTTLAHNPVVQLRLGKLWADVQRVRDLVHTAALKADNGAEDALLALCSAKAEVAEVERVVADAMTVMGGSAYGADHPIHKLYRDSRAAHVMAPTTDMLRQWTGRALLGLPLLTD